MKSKLYAMTKHAHAHVHVRWSVKRSEEENNLSVTEKLKYKGKNWVLLSVSVRGCFNYYISVQNSFEQTQKE